MPSSIMDSHSASGVLSPVFGTLVGAGVGEGVGGAALSLVKALMRRFPVVESGPGLYKSNKI